MQMWTLTLQQHFPKGRLPMVAKGSKAVHCGVWVQRLHLTYNLGMGSREARLLQINGWQVCA